MCLYETALLFDTVKFLFIDLDFRIRCNMTNIFNSILARHIFYQPYFMLYGEVFAPDIDPPCNETCTEYGECGMTKDNIMMVPCQPGMYSQPHISLLPHNFTA